MQDNNMNEENRKNDANFFKVFASRKLGVTFFTALISLIISYQLLEVFKSSLAFLKPFMDYQAIIYLAFILKFIFFMFVILQAYKLFFNKDPKSKYSISIALPILFFAWIFSDFVHHYANRGHSYITVGHLKEKSLELDEVALMQYAHLSTLGKYGVEKNLNEANSIYASLYKSSNLLAGYYLALNLKEQNKIFEHDVIIKDLAKSNFLFAQEYLGDIPKAEKDIKLNMDSCTINFNIYECSNLSISGDPRAQYKLSRKLKVAKDLNKYNYFYWLNKSSENGYWLAEGGLGYALSSQGNQIRQDYNKAYDLFVNRIKSVELYYLSEALSILMINNMNKAK